MMKNIILYDFLLVKGGAESLTLTLCQATPDLDLGVAFIDPLSFPKIPLTNDKVKVFSSLTKILGWQSIKASFGFEYRAQVIANYDKVVFSGSNAPLAVKYREQGGNILYCHTPPRFIYDLKGYYLAQFPWWKRGLLKLLIAYIQPKFERSIKRMDLVIANSKNVKGRLKKHLNQESIVIYPPCHINKYEWKSQGDYYLSTARVEPFKRIKLIVKAFMLMPNKKLIVASGGSELTELQFLARNNNNISFTGWCEQAKLIHLINHSIATIYLPIDEDFGISPVESMAAGKPVIGVKEGGVTETVIAGETGLLCPSEPSVSDIVLAVKTMTPNYALSLKAACISRSKQFSAEVFIEKMQAILNSDNSSLLDVAKRVDAS